MDKVQGKQIDYIEREAKAKAMAPKLYTSAPRKSDPRRLWDNYEEVAVIQKSDRLRFLVAAGTREGYRCVNIREFYYVKRDNMWKPGRDGIMIPIAAPINKTRKPDPNNPPKIIKPLNELLKAICQAADVAMQMELEDPEKAVWLLPKVKLKEETSNEDC